MSASTITPQVALVANDLNVKGLRMSIVGSDELQSELDVKCICPFVGYFSTVDNAFNIIWSLCTYLRGQKTCPYFFL